MKYKSFNLTNFIGLKYFSPESIAELKGENEKYKQSEKTSTPEKTQAKAVTKQCAKCKKKYEPKDENYVYSYSEKKKDYKKFFLCDNCLMKCKKCNKTGNTGAFVYIWSKQKNDYDKLFYCMGCYKKANLKQCMHCKKRTDSETVVGGKSFCKGCHKTDTKKVKPGPKDDSELLKVRREEVRKDLEQQLTKKSKDNLELLSTMNELRSIDISQLENSKFYQSIKKLKNMDMSDLSINKISNFIENLKNAFEMSKEELNATDSVVIPINATIDILEKVSPNGNKNYKNEVKELTSILTQLETIN